MSQTYVEEKTDTDDDYTDFSPNNMMKATEFEELSPSEQEEMERLLAISA